MRVDDVLRLAADNVGPLRSPVLLVALSGFFDIGATATDALERFAADDLSITIGEIDPDPFYDFTQTRPYIVIEDGERVIQWPENRIHLVRGKQRDLIVMIGTEPHLYWRTYALCVIEAAQRLGCEAVVTVGAHADATPHTRPPRVVSSTADPRLAEALGIGTPRYQGVTGVAGVLQAELAEVEMPAISVRVGVPHYLMNTDQPAAVLTLHQHLSRVLGLDVPDADDDDVTLMASARELHDELVANDPQLAYYVAMLEKEYDRLAEQTMPTSDELGAQFEAFLNTLGAPDAEGPTLETPDDPGSSTTNPDDGE